MYGEGDIRLGPNPLARREAIGNWLAAVLGDTDRYNSTEFFDALAALQSVNEEVHQLNGTAAGWLPPAYRPLESDDPRLALL